MDITDASDNFMARAGIEILPPVNKILGEIEALLMGEDIAIINRIKPVLEDTKRAAAIVVNLFSFTDLAAKLMILVGHLSVDKVLRPVVFVGHSFDSKTNP
jgi:hypothetical protein